MNHFCSDHEVVTSVIPLTPNLQFMDLNSKSSSYFKRGIENGRIYTGFIWRIKTSGGENKLRPEQNAKVKNFCSP